MKEWHPDRFQDKTDAEKLEAEKQSKTLIEAYHFLVSIAPETLSATIDQYEKTLETSGIADFEYKNETLKVTFSDGSVYEYFEVPKSAYSKLVNAPSQARFFRRHIGKTYIYRSTSKLVASQPA